VVFPRAAERCLCALRSGGPLLLPGVPHEYNDGFPERVAQSATFRCSRGNTTGQPETPSDPDLNLVVVLETNDAFALALAKSC